ncbi:MAG: transcriptional repressor LexA [Lentisphaerae bacterium]|jgi:repressor LexA|nr:transcriptional repressor LexA [Lentisphaerota bacterium]MBT4821389.1 transcriptional repressor LexA [Lentisphaerota bacterium]MBT5608066.1 transcriptional repressor LexA [Lentisphaerota bacterium]MBT7057586.1 transcriptional repressor LexA [Lentisphaerota bacterium]MBT7840213.1 transcriptional repressor LexA [Lentisphaerota bacterium]
MKGLTQKQQEILDFIDQFMRREGMAPTVYEIADYFDIKSATAFAHLRALQRKGYVTRSSKARSLTLVRADHPKHMSLTLSIPLLGRISAGMPLLAEEHIENTIHFDPTMLPKGAGGHPLFALTVFGDSMRDQGILDGDTVIAKQVPTANIGDLVVALVDNETTVKSLYFRDDMAELRPANPDYESQFYPLDRVSIQGVVIALHRTL